MAFTGTVANTVVGKNTTLIKGASLALNAAGTIGNYGDTGADHQLPSTAPALDADATEVLVHEIAAGVLQPIVHSIGGSPLRITVRNNDLANASGELRIRVKNEHTLTK